MGGVRVTGHLRAARGGRALRVAAIALGCAALGPVLLSACGSTPAPASGAAPAASASPGASASPDAAASPGAGSASVPLCQHAATVTGLRIVRLPAPSHVPQEQAAFGERVALGSPAQARAVARALCALPVMPRGVLNCPALFPGTSYRLTFTAPGRLFAPVTIEATGCETVTGVGQVRRATDPGFWRVLAVAAGVSPPGLPVFARPGCTPLKSGVKVNGCPALM
jgi:hypothetical protein